MAHPKKVSKKISDKVQSKNNIKSIFQGQKAAMKNNSFFPSAKLKMENYSFIVQHGVIFLLAIKNTNLYSFEMTIKYEYNK